MKVLVENGKPFSIQIYNGTRFAYFERHQDAFRYLEQTGGTMAKVQFGGKRNGQTVDVFRVASRNT